MKKFLTFAAVSFVAFSTSAFAKTEGSYIGIDAINTKTSFYQSSIANGNVVISKPTTSHATNGAGLKYNYAFNFDGLFIAPGVFVEQNSFGGSKVSATSDRYLQTRNRYGFKTDVGYDISDLFSPYLSIGYAGVHYKTRIDGEDTNNNLVLQSRSGSAANFFYGAGIKLNCSKSISLNLEYNYQNFRTKNSIPSQVDYISKSQFITRLDIFKVGVSYNF